MIEPIEPTDRWWLVNGVEVDLDDDRAGIVPVNARAAVLARKYAETPEDHDLAAYLEWALIEHPKGVDRVALEFLFDKSRQIYERLDARLTEFERRAA